MYCFVEGVEFTKASVDHPSIMIARQKTMPSTTDMWSGPGHYVVEGVGLTKASVDHRSIMIRGQKNMPSTTDTCRLDHVSILWRVWSSPKRV